MATRAAPRDGIEPVQVHVFLRALAALQIGVYFIFIVSLSLYAVIAGGVASARPLFQASAGTLRAYLGGSEDAAKGKKRSSDPSHATSPDEADAHSLVDYPPVMLRIYDITLLYNNTVGWGVSTRQLQTHFDASVSAHHLDVGVGSGYLPAHSKPLQKLAATKSGQTPSLALWDLNAAPLQYASARVARACGTFLNEKGHLNITTRTADILGDKDFAAKTQETPFQTVSMFYLFHCVPNPTIRGKQKLTNQDASTEKFARGFENVRRVAAKGATIMGATILTPNDTAVQAACTPLQFALGHAMMDLYQNRFKHFYNHYDTLDNIRTGAERAGLTIDALLAHGFVAFFVLRNA